MENDIINFTITIGRFTQIELSSNNHRREVYNAGELSHILTQKNEQMYTDIVTHTLSKIYKTLAEKVCILFLEQLEGIGGRSMPAVEGEVDQTVGPC